MSNPFKRFAWLVFALLILTASLPWWSHEAFTTLLTLQTVALIVLAFIWLIAAWWWAQTDMYLRLEFSLSLWSIAVGHLANLVVLAGVIWGTWWVSNRPWLHLSPIAHHVFLAALAIGGICWFVEAIAFWISVVCGLTNVAIVHYRSRWEYRRRRGF